MMELLVIGGLSNYFSVKKNVVWIKRDVQSVMTILLICAYRLFAYARQWYQNYVYIY